MDPFWVPTSKRSCPVGVESAFLTRVILMRTVQNIRVSLLSYQATLSASTSSAYKGHIVYHTTNYVLGGAPVLSLLSLAWPLCSLGCLSTIPPLRYILEFTFD